MKEKRLRSILKAMSWRIIATFTTATIVFVFTGDFVLSIGVGLVEVVSKLTLYYFHERVWDKVGFGKAHS